MKDYAKIDTSEKISLIKPILEGIAFSFVVVLSVALYFILAAN